MEDEPLFERKPVDPKLRKRRIWLIAIGAVVVGLLFFGSQFLSIYVDALWFSSVGYSSVYWYKFKLGAALFLIFFLATFIILWVAFALLARAFPQLRQRQSLKLSAVEDIREINLLPYIYRPGMWVVSIGLALMFAVGMAQSWSDFALFLHSSPSGVADPIFHKDVSFYLFSVPVLNELSQWITSLSVVLLIGVGGSAAYLWYHDKVKGFGTLDMAKRAASVVSLATAFFALALAFSTYLSRFDLLDAPHDLFSGISYADDHAQLPGLGAVIVVLLLSAIVLAFNAFTARKVKAIGWCAGAVIGVWVVGTLIVPQSVYSFSVKPNELAKESPYIEHNIQMTRGALGIDRFEERQFTPASTLGAADLDKSGPTISNIRLWDPKVLQQTLSQIQEIRQYYDFGVPDIDRYVVNGQLREVMLAARELKLDKLSPESRTWINEHVVYTHGYGVTMSTVNEFSPEGLPHLILKDMPVQSDAPEIKVTRPEVYFGEETTEHVYVHARPQGKNAPEFNYPAAGNQDSYSEYEGHAGIQIGGFLRKLLLSIYLGDGTNLIFSDYISPESRLLIHRTIRDRVQTIAPFLMIDNDPYLVIGDNGKLYWIVDAYTYSARYPYASAYTLNDYGVTLNYVRNSVKIVVDAYEGTATFYAFDPNDPILKDYESIFPVLFHPSSEMPADLRRHIRYPNTLVQIQAAAYTLYHMRDPSILYSHEDLWAVPSSELPASVPGGAPPPMRPYYVLMQIPGEPNNHAEFVNILPFTPAGPGRNNMIGWMAGRSDGDNYGHAVVFSFPKNVTIDGPAQVRARVNQDPALSQLMTLWSQKGSNLIRGNLLVIPIAQSLMYVEPFFLQAESSPLPELRQVAVVTQERLAAAPTFPDAMTKLFGGAGIPGVQLAQTGQGGAGPSGASPGGQAAGAGQPKAQASPPGPNAQSLPGGPNAAPARGDVAGLTRQAQQLLSDYGRLTAEGKYKEAGDKLSQLKQTLDELAKRGGG